MFIKFIQNNYDTNELESSLRVLSTQQIEEDEFRHLEGEYASARSYMRA